MLQQLKEALRVNKKETESIHSWGDSSSSKGKSMDLA